MAIISAMNFTSISRLKKTWEKLSGKLLTQYQELEVGAEKEKGLLARTQNPFPQSLQTLLSPSSNFKNYREEMASLLHAGDVVPVFSLMIKVRFICLHRSLLHNFLIPGRTCTSPKKRPAASACPMVTSTWTCCGSQSQNITHNES